ncbi:hypothetical protein RYX36_022413 [Vicia faba]
MTAFMHILGYTRDSLKKILLTSDFVGYPEDNHMHCTARLVEMLNLYANDLESCDESDAKKNFLMEEIKVLEEAKWIGLPNFMPRTAFLTILQRKVKGISYMPINFVDSVWNYLETVLISVLNCHSSNYYQLQVSICGAAELLIEKKKKSSIQHVLEAVQMEKLTDYTCNPEYLQEYNKLISHHEFFLKEVFYFDSVESLPTEPLHPNVLLALVTLANVVQDLLVKLYQKEWMRNKMATAENEYTLDSVRKALVRQEDTIVFGLIERAKFPFNFHTYDKNYLQLPGFCGSLVEFVFQNTETVQAKAGRYENPEENPFFPENLQPLLVPSYPFTKILHSGAASVNINKSLWKMYFDELLPLFVASGDDGNYAQTAASDLSLLQAISKRVHYGKFVAEVKFRESPQDYEPLIRDKDREGLMKLLTFKSVEEMVKKRVEKKATLFGQEISLDSNDDSKEKKKFDPSVASKLYEKWVIPLTKEVQVDYLLRRLD